MEHGNQVFYRRIIEKDYFILEKIESSTAGASLMLIQPQSAPAQSSIGFAIKFFEVNML